MDCIHFAISLVTPNKLFYLLVNTYRAAEDSLKVLGPLPHTLPHRDWFARVWTKWTTESQSSKKSQVTIFCLTNSR